MVRVLGYGVSLRESFARWNQRSRLWRTSQRCLLGGWTKFSGRWPRSGLMLNGHVFRRRSLPSRTIGIDYSLWPTPVASDGRRLQISVNALAKEYGRRRGSEGKGPACANLMECMASEFGFCPHPEFVEWMMGFPQTWTDLGDLETRSPQRSQNGLANE